MVTEIEYLKIPKIKDVVYIQGIAPGAGYVGRNVVGYMVYMLNAKKFGELYSDSLPPIVGVDHDGKGLVVPMKYELYYYKGNKKKKIPNIVFMIGDAQPVTTEGYYEISDTILDFLEEEFGIKEVISIGGFSTGNLVEGREAKVFGATNNLEHAKKFEEKGTLFRNTNVTQIVGAAGVIIGEATRKGITATCLMGETSGLLLSDPKATESVLKVLKEYLNLEELDLSKIHEHVKEVEKIISKIEEMEKAALEQLRTHHLKKKKKDEKIGYIG